MNVRNLLDIHSCYQQKGGEFWVALSDGKVIGTIGLLLREQNCAIMKKFFVKREFRSQKIGLALYQELLQFAKAAGSIFLSGQEKILCSENTRYIMTSTTSQTSGITFICLVPEQLINMEIQQLQKKYSSMLL